MNRNAPVLPSLRDVVDMDHAPRGTPTGPNASWTAVNHRLEGPVSPRTQHPTPALHRTLSPPSQHTDRPALPALPQEPSTTPSSATDFTHGGVPFHAPPLRSSTEHHAAGKPITPRQDSAVFPSLTASTLSPLLLGSTSARSARSPERNHPTAAHTTTHPLTPPSDPSTLQHYPSTTPTHTPSYQSHHVSLVPGVEQEAAAMDRSHSNAQEHVASPILPTALFQERDKMPPPPVPTSTHDAPPVPSGVGTSQYNPRYSPDASDPGQERSEERCAHCHETWTYPPLDTTELAPAERPKTYQDMLQKMSVLSHLATNYHAQKDVHFKRWKEIHATCHCNCPDRQTGNKRKLEEPCEDDGLPPWKSQKRASPSPPRISRLTPPPDQRQEEATSDSAHAEPKTGPRLTPHVARVLGPYIHPADDSNNMFYDTHGQTQRVKKEETAH